MKGKIKYEFAAKIWQYSGKAAWYFVSLPQDMSMEIRTHLKSEEEGWGRLKAIAKINNSQWDTAIWFDIKLKTYLLPIKAVIRKNENLEKNNVVKLSIWI